MTDQPSADRLVAEARRNVHESLTLLPAWEADRVRSLIADLETAVEGRAAMRAAVPAPAPASQTHGLSVQHADALWDAIATPGPDRPTFVEQHEGVCRVVAGIIGELTPGAEPPADRAALRDRITAAIKSVPGYYLTDDEAREAADAVLAVLPPPADRAAEEHRLALSRALGLGTGAPWDAIHERVADLRRMADEAQPATQAACTCGETACESDLCDCDSAPCPVDHANEEQPVTEARTTLRCNWAATRHRHGPHDWQPQPGMPEVRCPGYPAPPAAPSM